MDDREQRHAQQLQQLTALRELWAKQPKDIKFCTTIIWQFGGDRPAIAVPVNKTTAMATLDALIKADQEK